MQPLEIALMGNHPSANLLVFLTASLAGMTKMANLPATSLEPSLWMKRSIKIKKIMWMGDFNTWKQS